MAGDGRGAQATGTIFSLAMCLASGVHHLLFIEKFCSLLPNQIKLNCRLFEQSSCLVFNDVQQNSLRPFRHNTDTESFIMNQRHIYVPNLCEFRQFKWMRLDVLCLIARSKEGYYKKIIWFAKITLEK